MKNVGIITLHKSYSYGACLQAYATKQIIEKLGFHADFVNYVNDNEQCQKQYICTRKDYSIKQRFIASLKACLLGRIENEKTAFSSFHLNDLSSKECVSEVADIECSEYDFLVSGSDQLWNPQIFGGIDPAYFLQFGDCKKISYAASAGSHVYNQKERLIIQKYLKCYSNISVRELALKSQLEDLVDADIKEVVDPTLLLDGCAWRSLANSNSEFYVDEPYIFVYLIGVSKAYHREHYANIANDIKKHFGCKAYFVRSDKLVFDGCDANLRNLTPWDLIQCIANAKFVICSSFHGAAFSVNLNKNFLALDNPSNPLRVANLLNGLGLQSKRYVPGNSLAEYLNEPDYDDVNKKLETMRLSSIRFLSDALERDIDV